MNSPASPTHELLQAFVRNALPKIQELSGIANIIIDEGPNSDLLESIFRITLAIKSFAFTCNQQNILNFISSSIDVQFNHLRFQHDSSISSEQKKSITDNILILKNMVSALDAGQGATDKNDKTKSKEEYLAPSDKRMSLLNAIGQLSIWSYHDILNSLSKIDGFTEIALSAIEKIDNSQTALKEDLKSTLTKTLENTSFISNSINFTRALRGKTIFQEKDYKFQDLIELTQLATLQPKLNAPWSLVSLPDVVVRCDKIIFAQMWSHLWMLLHEWQIPGTVLTPSFATRLTSAPSSANAQNYKYLLSLYIWTEASSDAKFLPENLTYTKQTPYPDLAHIFYFSSLVSEKIQAKVTCSKTPSGNGIFRIEIPCSEIGRVAEVSSSSNTDPNSAVKAGTVRKSVLIVDDEKDLRTIVSMKINRMGYSVFIASNLQEAHQILKEKEISLVISDLFLEKESGLDLLKSLSASGTSIPFVFITGADEDDVPASIFKMLTKYARAFLTKPVSTALLKETIQKIIGPGSF